MITLQDVDDDVFDLLAEAADEAYARNKSRDALQSPEDDEDDIDLDYDLESDDEDVESDDLPTINININPADVEEDDNSLLEDGLDALAEQNADNNKLLQSIDETLKDQYEAEEEQRRKNAIVRESDSPFTDLLANDIVDNRNRPGPNNQNDSGGGLSDLFGGNGRNDRNDRDRRRDRTRRRRPQSRAGRMWERAKGALSSGKGKGALIGVTAAVLSGLALDSALTKFGMGGISGVADDLSGDKDDVVTPSNATASGAFVNDTPSTVETALSESNVRNDVIDDRSVVNNATQDNSKNILIQKLGAAGYSAEDAASMYSSNGNDYEKALKAFEEGKRPVSSEETGGLPDGVLAAGLAATAGGLAYKAGKYALNKFSSTVEVVPPELRDLGRPPAPPSPPSAGGAIRGLGSFAMKKLPLVNAAMIAASLGTDISDQRSKEYASEEEKNRDTAKLVGKGGTDAVLSIGGSAVGGVIGGLLGSIAGPVGMAVGATIGNEAGAAVGEWVSETTGVNEAVGNAAVAVYDVASDAMDSVKSLYKDVTNFFSDETDQSVDMAETQKEVLEKMSDDIVDKTTKGSPTGGMFSGWSNMFSMGKSSESPPVKTPPPSYVLRDTNDYKIKSDNAIVIPPPEPKIEPEPPATAAEIQQLVTNVVNNQKQANAPTARATVVSDSPVSPKSNSYTAQRPSLSSIPTHVDDATLTLINVGTL